MMKIVVNAYSARLGGGQTYLRNLLANLPRGRGLEVLVFGPDSLEVPAHPDIRRVKTRWPTTNPLMRTLWECFALPGFLRRERADVLFCPGGVVATRAPDGCRTVSTFQNMIPFTPDLVKAMPWGLQRLRNLVLRHVLLRSLASSDLSIFISDHARALIESKVHIRNAVTVPHGIADIFRRRDALAPPPELETGRYILYVSRFDIYKHHREVVQAYAALPDALRTSHPLVFVGETNAPQARHVARQIEALGLEQQVRIVGPVAHAALPAYYQHAAAILFASSCENCPNILLESMAAGRPVLSSDVMPMPEFGGDAVAYFSPYDPRSLTKVVADVLGDQALASRLAEAAARSSRRYDWGTAASRTWNAILQLGSGRAATQT